MRRLTASGLVERIGLLEERRAVIGAPFVLLVTRTINGLLVYSPPINPVTVAAVFGVLFAATLVASLVPARRASLDPVIVLRSE